MRHDPSKQSGFSAKSDRLLGGPAGAILLHHIRELGEVLLILPRKAEVGQGPHRACVTGTPKRGPAAERRRRLEMTVMNRGCEAL